MYLCFACASMCTSVFANFSSDGTSSGGISGQSAGPIGIWAVAS